MLVVVYSVHKNIYFQHLNSCNSKQVFIVVTRFAVCGIYIADSLMLNFVCRIAAVYMQGLKKNVVVASCFNAMYASLKVLVPLLEYLK